MPTTAWGRDPTRPGVLSCLLALCLFLPPPLLAQTIIGEVNWAGSSRSLADEWLELWNLSNEPQILNGWSLEGSSVESIQFTSDHIIGPQQVFLVANYASTNSKSALNISPDLVTSTLSLSNNHLHLVLRNQEGIIIDEVGDGGNPPAGSTVSSTSMIRAIMETIPQTSSTWINQERTVNLDEDIFDKGTPGICDRCTIVHQNTTSSIAETVSSTQVTIDAGSSTHVETTSSTNSVTSTVDFVTTTNVVITFEESTTTRNAVTSTNANVATSTGCLWHLSTIFPAPRDGNEWVEIVGCNGITERPDGWSLHDPQGLILLITSSTSLQKEEESLRIELSGSHLRNTGDAMILQGPDKVVHDNIIYPSMQHEEHYVRRSQGDWWIPERASTNNSPPQIPSPNRQTFVPTPTPPIASSTIAVMAKYSSTEVLVQTTLPMITSMSYEEFLAKQTKEKKEVSTRIVVKKPVTTSVVTKKTPAKSPVKKTSPMSVSSLSPRVALQGITGTPPSFISKHQFVLLNADGRGLLVHGNGKQPSPTLGTPIRVTGTLVTNDNGTYLDMRTRDKWESHSALTDVTKTKAVDLDNTTAEDDWSLIEIEGRVQESAGTNVKLIVNDTEVNMTIHKSLKYRAERLEKGDLVRIQGVLDLRQETPRIYPREASDIVIVARATHPSSVANTSHTLPPWAPIAAAGTTIATAYSLRRLREWYAQKRLAQQLSLAVKELSSSS